MLLKAACQKQATPARDAFSDRSFHLGFVDGAERPVIEGLHSNGQRLDDLKC